MIYGKTWTAQEKQRYNVKKRELEESLESLEVRITELQENLADSEISFEKFLNTLKSLITSYKTKSGEDKLKIAEILVLNIFIKGGEVHQIELSEPFNTLLSDKNPYWLPE